MLPWVSLRVPLRFSVLPSETAAFRKEFTQVKVPGASKEGRRLLFKFVQHLAHMVIECWVVAQVEHRLWGSEHSAMTTFAFEDRDPGLPFILCFCPGSPGAKC